ncbi:MAG TPA: diguanylate cyclase [Arenimonas sp.]|uniref:sensor domain-containing diguanylate cyclase n=1 Tax=Arenimonas sp. TaxID=1872635 RepID=UPI002C449362|nr:diguanylate cyclase [Arenimonas sp.]HMB57672.1 diguanylate cyclase [Arenimonas sp.]
MRAPKSLSFRLGLSLLLWWALCAISQAQTVIAVNEQFREIPAATAMALFEDTTAKLPFDQVRAAAFTPVGTRNTGFGFSKSAWWVRVDLRNTGVSDLEIDLRQDYPLIDYIDLWQQDGSGKWQVLHTGDRLVFGSRPIANRDFIFPLRIAAGQTRTIYLRYETSGSMNIGLTLASPHRVLESVSLEQLAYGFYFGGFCVLFFYNLFIFIAVRDRAFFYYLAYAASYGLYFGVHDGLSFQFLWPNSPVWANQSLLVLLCLSLLSGLMFTRHFLGTHEHSPRLDRAAQILQLLSVVGLAASFFLPYALLIQPIAYVTIAAVAVMMALGVIGVIQGYRPAIYFMLAWFALLVGVLVYMLKTFGLLPHNGLTQNGFQAGALLEMVLLSLALASRVNELQRQTLTDALTSLSNRRYFDRQLEVFFAHSREGAVALLVIDLDHFKRINDNFGHARGDDVLIECARLLRAHVPAGATVCRYGGEEFSIILPAASVAEAERVAENIRQAIEMHFTGRLPVTVSIGLASTASHRFANEAEFFEAADSALYRAKGAGRNRVEVFASA